MAGVRDNGILLTTDTGGSGPGTSVGITSPIGQQTMAASVGVVIASDQSAIPVTGSLVLSGAVNQGTQAAVANAWPITVTDAVNTAKVRAASSPAAYTDAALVATIRDLVANGEATGTASGKYLPVGGVELGANQWRALPLWNSGSILALNPRNANQGLITQPQASLVLTTGSVLNALYPAAGGFISLDGGLTYNGQSILLTIHNTGSFIGTIRLRGTAYLQSLKTDVVVINAATGIATVDMAAGNVYVVPGGGLFNAYELYTTAYTSGSCTIGFCGTNNNSAILGAVSIVNPVAVTGPLTDTQLRATPVPISGTVTATTGGLTDTQLRLTPVPISGSVTANTGLSQPLTDAQLRALAVPISAATLPLPTNAATSALQTQPGVDIGDVTINNAAGAAAVNIQDGGNSVTVDAPVGTPVFVRLSDGAATLIGQKAMAASLPIVIASDQTVIPVSAPTLTKGTQGANGFSTQDLKDAGRNQVNFFMAAGIAGTNAEVMQSLTGYKSGAAVGATVTPAVVTAGKTYRVNSITISFQSLAAAGGCLFRLRANTAGVAVVTSPLVEVYTIGSAAAVAGITTTLNIAIPDGMEFAAGTGIAVGMVGLSAVGAAAASGFGTILIKGYEY